MSFKIDSLLKDKVILYIVLFFAVTNFFGYIMMNNYDAIISMILAGLITSYFSKNMIVILLISIIGGSLVTGASSINEGVKHRVREGMGNKENFNGAGFFGSSHSGDEKDGDDDKKKTAASNAAESKAQQETSLYQSTESKKLVKAYDDGEKEQQLLDKAKAEKAEKAKEDSDEHFATRPRKKRKNSYKGASSEMDDKMAGLNDAEHAMDRLDEILGGSSIDALLKNQQGLTKAVGALEPLMNKAEGMINSITSTGLVEKLTGMTQKMEGKI